METTPKNKSAKKSGKKKKNIEQAKVEKSEDRNVFVEHNKFESGYYNMFAVVKKLQVKSLEIFLIHF